MRRSSAQVDVIEMGTGAEPSDPNLAQQGVNYDDLEPAEDDECE